MVETACAAQYTADINLVTGTTSTGIQRQRVESLGAPISGTWSRVADQISEAVITVDVAGDCGAQLARRAPYLGFIELVIARDGQVVFAGPITDIAQSSRGRPARIAARDIAYWLTGAVLGVGGFTGSGDLTTQAVSMLTKALTTGPAPGIFRRDSGLILDNLGTASAGISADYLNDDRFATPDAALGDLVAMGLTWTVVNYRLLLGGRPDVDTVPVETVTDDDFTDDLETSVSIDDLVTYAWATSSDDATPPRSAYVSGDQLPRLTAVVDAGDSTAESALRAAARSALFWPARPVIASPDGTMLRVPDFTRAIPGRVVWEVQTEFLGQPIRQAMHLESVQVDWSAEGSEDIKPGLTPIGTAVPIDDV